MPHTRTPDIEPINVAYLGAARRSYNVSKKRVYFHAFIEQIYFSLTTVVDRDVTED